MFVFTFDARLFTFQYDKPHFDPLLRLPPNRARTHTDSPVMSRSSFLCRRFYHNFSRLCRSLALFPKSWKIPLRSMSRRVNPPNLPLRGSKLPRSPSAATQQQAVYKKGSPRWTRTRTTQGCSHTSTTNHTSTRGRGRHRTGQLLCRLH